MAALGKDKEAEKTYRDAISAWESAAIPSELGPEKAVRQGVIYDRLGNRSESQKRFRQAIREDPNRSETYNQLLSFLVIAGRLEDAKEFFRLAYNQDRIEVMWKIYYSLWVEGLSLRQGNGSFDLAREYLEFSRVNTWQGKLARFFSGKMTFEDLNKEAVNNGQRVEATYYSALMALGQGKKGDAEALFTKVIDSNLLGFFEYRMARSILLEEFPGDRKSE